MSYRTAELAVAIVAMPRVIALDFSIPAHILGSHNGYRVMVCAEADGAAGDMGDESRSFSDTGVGIKLTHSLSGLASADIVVVPGFEDPDIPLPVAYLDAIRGSADRGARMVAICTGTFGLAASGILDGRDATTHWRYVSRLRELYPTVNVIENKLFIEDGKILTSAGAGAGIDACLHLIRTDFGAAAAHEAGKGVVASPARSGDQPQYVDVLTRPRSELFATRAWVMENIGGPITVRRMAERSNMSRRTFVRHFEKETGMPPMRWVVLQRILSARQLLEKTDWSVEKIAAATGFGSAANFRSIFRREVGTTPSAYRKAYSPDAQSRNPNLAASVGAGGVGGVGTGK